MNSPRLTNILLIIIGVLLAVAIFVFYQMWEDTHVTPNDYNRTDFRSQQNPERINQQQGVPSPVSDTGQTVTSGLYNVFKPTRPASINYEIKYSSDLKVDEQTYGCGSDVECAPVSYGVSFTNKGIGEIARLETGLISETDIPSQKYFQGDVVFGANTFSQYYDVKGQSGFNETTYVYKIGSKVVKIIFYDKGISFPIDLSSLKIL